MLSEKQNTLSKQCEEAPINTRVRSQPLPPSRTNVASMWKLERLKSLQSSSIHQPRHIEEKMEEKSSLQGNVPPSLPRPQTNNPIDVDNKQQHKNRESLLSYRDGFKYDNDSHMATKSEKDLLENDIKSLRGQKRELQALLFDMRRQVDDERNKYKAELDNRFSHQIKEAQQHYQQLKTDLKIKEVEWREKESELKAKLATTQNRYEQIVTFSTKLERRSAEKEAELAHLRTLLATTNARCVQLSEELRKNGGAGGVPSITTSNSLGEMAESDSKEDRVGPLQDDGDGTSSLAGSDDSSEVDTEEQTPLSYRSRRRQMSAPHSRREAEEVSEKITVLRRLLEEGNQRTASLEKQYEQTISSVSDLNNKVSSYEQRHAEAEERCRGLAEQLEKAENEIAHERKRADEILDKLKASMEYASRATPPPHTEASHQLIQRNAEINREEVGDAEEGEVEVENLEEPGKDEDKALIVHAEEGDNCKENQMEDGKGSEEQVKIKCENEETETGREQEVDTDTIETIEEEEEKVNEIGPERSKHKPEREDHSKRLSQDSNAAAIPLTIHVIHPDNDEETLLTPTASPTNSDVTKEQHGNSPTLAENESRGSEPLQNSLVVDASSDAASTVTSVPGKPYQFHIHINSLSSPAVSDGVGSSPRSPTGNPTGNGVDLAPPLSPTSSVYSSDEDENALPASYLEDEALQNNPGTGSGLYLGTCTGKKRKTDKVKRVTAAVSDRSVVLRYQQGPWYQRKNVIEEYCWTREMVVNFVDEECVSIGLEHVSAAPVWLEIRPCKAIQLQDYIQTCIERRAKTDRRKTFPHNFQARVSYS